MERNQRHMDKGRHVDEGTLHAWLDGALSPDDAVRVEDHVNACAACGAAAAEARGLIAAASRILTALDDVPGGVAPGGHGAGGPSSLSRHRALTERRPPFWMSPQFRAAAAIVFVVAGSLAVVQRLMFQPHVEPLEASHDAAPPSFAPAPPPLRDTVSAPVPALKAPAPLLAKQQPVRKREALAKEASPAPAVAAPEAAPAIASAAAPKAAAQATFFDSARADSTARFQKTVTVTGRVVSATTGEPVAQAQVLHGNPPAETTTNDSGQYVISIPAGQPVELRLRRIGYESKRDSVTVAQAASRDTVRRDIAMAPATMRLSEVVVTGAGTRQRATDAAKAAAPSAAAVSGFARKALPSPMAPGCDAPAADTGSADTLFWQSQTLAHAGNGEPATAAACAARGLAKFPNNETLMLLEGQELAAAGQVAQAKAVLLQLLQKNPENANAAQILLTVYVQAGNPDSTLWALHIAIAAGVPPATTAAIALSQGSRYYRKGNASKNRDTLDIALKFLAYSDSLVPDPRPKFLIGAAAFTAGYEAATEANEEKSCPLAKAANDYLVIAENNTPSDLSDAQLGVQRLQQLMSFVQKEIKRYCK